MDRWQPVNALQQLIADYLSDHPEENFSTIARRGGIPRQTVQALAKRERARQTPRPETIKLLAKGLQMPESLVRTAAGLTAGYGQGSEEMADTNIKLLIEIAGQLDPERFEAVARRARLLLEEQMDEERHRRRSR